MTFRRLLGYLLLLVCQFTSSAPAEELSFEGDEIASTVKLADGAEFSVKLERGPWNAGSYKIPQLWGAWGTTPKTVVVLLQASRSKTALYIPFSAYADLAEPRSAVLRTKGKNVELEIAGGTGGDSYRAILVFASGKFLSVRRVISSIMPNEAREETRYLVLQEK